MNRLRRGMPLQADPTVLYGRTDGDRRIRRVRPRASDPAQHLHHPGAAADADRQPGPRGARGGVRSGRRAVPLLRRPRRRLARVQRRRREAQPGRGSAATHRARAPAVAGRPSRRCKASSSGTASSSTEMGRSSTGCPRISAPVALAIAPGPCAAALPAMRAVSRSSRYATRGPGGSARPVRPRPRAGSRAARRPGGPGHARHATLPRPR